MGLLFITVLLYWATFAIMSAHAVPERSRKLSQLLYSSIADQSRMDISMAKKILGQFKGEDSLVGSVGDSIPVLHHLLNIFRLSGDDRIKLEVLDVVLNCMRLGADASHSYNSDPPLLFKLILLKEVNVTKEAIATSPKALLDLLMGSWRWSSGFFSQLYSMPSESVPLAKLLLYADTLVRSKGIVAMGGIEGLKKLLGRATLGKPTVRPSDMNRFSAAYSDVVASLGGKQGKLRLVDMIRCLDETAGAVHEVLLKTILQLASRELRDEAALQLVRVLAAAPAVAVQDASPYGMGRNALHFLCLSGSTVLVRQLAAFLVDLRVGQLPTGSTAAEMDGGELDESAVSATYKVCLELLKGALTTADARGHTPISYSAMRFSQESPSFAAVRELAAAVGVPVGDALAAATERGVLRPPLSSGSDGSTVASSGTGEGEQQDGGGWDGGRLPGLPGRAEQPALDSRVVEVCSPALPSNKEFFRKYINTGTPVVFRQATAPSPPAVPSASTGALRSAFRKDSFLRKYSNFTVPAATIPYAGTFGVQQVLSSMGAVANSASRPSSSKGDDGPVPLYTFCTPAPQWAPLLQADVPVPRCITRGGGEAEDSGVGAVDSSTGSWSFEVQFYLGSAGTGAPVHFHGHAINSLAYGEKHWLLYPPSQAYYSTTPARALFGSGEQHPQAAEGAVYVVQRAGDVLYVPALWAHATLNAAQSIGVAHEFSVESFCME